MIDDLTPAWVFFQLNNLPLDLANGDIQNSSGFLSVARYLMKHIGHMGSFVLLEATEGSSGLYCGVLKGIPLEMLFIKCVPLAYEHCIFQQMLQLSHIAPIGLLEQKIHSFFGKSFFRLSMSLTGQLQKMGREGGNIHGPFSQGRQVNMGAFDAIKKIQSKQPFSAGFVKISVCGRNHDHIQVTILALTQALNRFLLQNPQQFSLQI